jgi:Armadillo/beta-catenin-like repeat
MLSLAGYYSCKRIICENKGIDAMIRCLSSNDADVQKNSIDTLAILVQVRVHLLNVYAMCYFINSILM